LITATAECFGDAAREYEELDEIKALHDFAQCAPDAVKPDLTARVRARLNDAADIIFDYDISDADDEHDIEHLRAMMWGFEKTFDVDLTSIYERLDEKLAEIQAPFEELPDDWFDRKDDGGSDATDADIVAMFGALSE
jgi:hypothetical protein